MWRTYELRPPSPIESGFVISRRCRKWSCYPGDFLVRDTVWDPKGEFRSAFPTVASGTFRGSLLRQRRASQASRGRKTEGEGPFVSLQARFLLSYSDPFPAGLGFKLCFFPASLPFITPTNTHMRAHAFVYSFVRKQTRKTEWKSE